MLSCLLMLLMHSNTMNRSAMLKNIERICPAAYIYAYNCYASHARLFVLGGKEIRSMEGTTQGNPPSMAFYAIGLLPLIWCLAEPVDHAKQAAYADDLTGAGKLKKLKQWFDSIVVNGPKLGCNCSVYMYLKAAWVGWYHLSS